MTDEQSPRQPDLLKATSVLSLVFAALWGAFVLLAPWIHRWPPPTDPALVNRWYRPWVAESDGIETQAMLAGVTACLWIAWLLASRIERVPWPRQRALQALCLVPAFAILAHMHSSNFTPLDGTLPNLALGGGILGVAVAGLVAGRLAAPRPWMRRLLAGVAWLALAALVLLGAAPGDTFNYGFFVGPARKLAAGEPLGSFYIQYNLVGTYLFRVLIAFRLLAHQMQAVLGLIVVLWLWLYWRLALRLLESRAMAFLFVFALVIVRVLAIADGGPATSPQVSPLRMDLWVPLALAVARFGIVSPATAGAFSFVYLADNVFGLLFFAEYAVALVAKLVGERRRGARPQAGTLVALAVPMLAVLAFQLVTFGSPTNSAAKTYQGLHLGFLPIETGSMFWLVACLLLLAMFPITRDPDPARRGASLFLYAFAAAQLVYFYGRSHDHNLLNVSGGWLLIAFVGLDRLRHHGLPARAPEACAAAAACLAGVAIGRGILPKLELAQSRLARGVLPEPFARDVEIDRAPNLFAAYPRKDRLYLFSANDAWYAYRYGLPQIGYFAPLEAAVLADPTAATVRALLMDGYTVVLYGALPQDLIGLNATPTMAAAGQRFALVPTGGPLFEVRLEPRAPNERP